MVAVKRERRLCFGIKVVPSIWDKPDDEALKMGA
jgi:hypothetical protein